MEVLDRNFFPRWFPLRLCFSGRVATLRHADHVGLGVIVGTRDTVFTQIGGNCKPTQYNRHEQVNEPYLGNVRDDVVFVELHKNDEKLSGVLGYFAQKFSSW